MSERIIIENRTDLSMVYAIKYVDTVLKTGRISGDGERKQYCYLTTFNDGIYVSAIKNKKSDRFVVWYGGGGR